MNLYKFTSKEKDLKMIWEIEKKRRKSYLVGTAHIFPYSFKKSLTRYISNVNTVLLEGPLDESNMSRVVERFIIKGALEGFHKECRNPFFIKSAKAMFNYQ